MNNHKTVIVFLMFVILASGLYSQSKVPAMVFEPPKDDGLYIEEKKVKIGGDFALQFQGLKQKADSIALIPLGTGFNLPTANMSINALLAKGIKLDLVLYLSSRHHNETWVKGGSLTIDALPFIKSQALEKVMQYVTFRVGDDEINYGDAHFRRSDNGRVITNPFVGNYLMDAFMTSPFAEVMVRKNDVTVLGGIGSGIVKQELTAFKAPSTYETYNTFNELAYYFKLAYDKQFNPDFRGRLSFSGYLNPRHHGGNLYGGDRTGSRYYLVMNRQTNNATDVDIKSQHLNGNLQPGNTYKNNSFMLNAFAKYKGFEVFADYELAQGKLRDKTTPFDFDQLALDVLYRFGSQEQFYIGGRYNSASDNENDISANRIHAIVGWRMLDSILLKLEYVKQRYSGEPSKTKFGKNDGFNGFVFESTVSF